jgi:hypothetical protein
MPGMVLGDIASRHRLYLAAKPSHLGVDVYGLAFPLHHPTVYSHQMRGQGFSSGTTLSHHAVVGGHRGRSWLWSVEGIACTSFCRI